MAALAEAGLDGLIVTHPANVRYLTGFTGTAGVLAVLREATVLVTDFRYQTQAEAEVGGWARVAIAAADTWSRLWQAVGEAARVERMGFEGHRLTVTEAQRLRAAAPERVQLEAVTGVVERLRVRKDPEEVEAIRQAGRLALEAFEAAVAAIRVGAVERDVAAALEAELRRRGSEWHPFPTIVASGPRSALPHARTGARSIAAGDLVLLDFGAEVNGYCADVTRTVVVGRAADERQRTVYELVEEAQRTARTGIRAGMTGQQADALARTLIERRGFGDAFGHSLGHGIGLELHEAPRVSHRNEEPLPPGAVVTIEPGIYLPGWGGVRIEDDVFLGAGGPELLTDGETQLRELK